MDRQKQRERCDMLLKKAAEAFHDDRSPFSDAFLIEHNVNIHECRWLSGTIGDLIDDDFEMRESLKRLTSRG